MSNHFLILKDAIIVDIDGTLTTDPLTIPLSEDVRQSKDAFLKSCGYYNQEHPRIKQIKLRENVINLIGLHMLKGVVPIFLTAREEARENINNGSRYNTYKYLLDIFHHFGYIDSNQLLMRTYNDFSPNYEVKESLYNEYIKNRFNVLFCLEDEEKNCEMFRKNGLLVLKVQ